MNLQVLLILKLRRLMQKSRRPAMQDAAKIYAVIDTNVVVSSFFAGWHVLSRRCHQCHSARGNHSFVQ